MPQTSAAMRYLTGRWILPMSGDPLEYGALELVGDKIGAVLSAQQFAAVRAASGAELPVEDYGEALILPGLINLHTHLEYSSLHLLDTEADLFDWIPLLMGQVKTWAPETFIESATMGALQMVRAGTTCILDSSFSGMAAVGAARAGLRAVIALELFGIVEDEAPHYFEQWLARKKTLEARFETGELPGFAEVAEAIADGTIQLSVAPHAPYTVGPRLTVLAKNWAEERGLPWTMHVAESPMESRWINSQDDRLDAFLQKVHTLPGGSVENISWRGCGKSAVQHLDDCGILQSSLVAAHVVQVDDADIDCLARRRVAVAHCPRSNSRLRSGIAPVGRMLDAGVRVGFGTDSAASTDDLNLLNEARFAWNLHRAVEPQFCFDARKAIHGLTAGAAQALGLSDKIGTLERGKFADIAIFNISCASQVSRSRPYDLLLYGNPPLLELFVAGKKLPQNRLY